MKKRTLKFGFCSLLFFGFHVQASLWQLVETNQRTAASEIQQDRFYTLDPAALDQVLSLANKEGEAVINSEIELPVSSGRIQRFRLIDSPVMAPGLSAKFPQIRSYKVYGIDDPFASGRLSTGPNGFHGMITSPGVTYLIDPDEQTGHYRSWRKDTRKTQPFQCDVKGQSHAIRDGESSTIFSPRSSGSLRVYRLALAATSEYVKAFGGSLPLVMAEMNMAISRVNQIYERDMAVRLVLVNDNDQLIYTGTPSSDPYTNADGNMMLEQNQSNIDTVIGAGNYDIGHVFSTGGGGVARLGSVCVNGQKAQGVTGLSNPAGDAFYIDFVAHEIGHQHNANHSFNGTSRSCGGNRNQSTAFEPGSGSTIMSYSGICGDENISTDAIAMFHAGSINEVDTFTTTGSGANCGTLISASNPSEPMVDAGADYTIPRKTAFILSATGSDADADSITFSWGQMDAGSATSTATLGFDLTDNSLFRSYLPQDTNSRHFPALGTTLQNKFDDSEVLACQSRNINFQVTVRDGKSGIGKDNVVVSVVNAIGPFQITSFSNPQILAPGSHTITWDVADTDTAPVNCSQVDISLLTFDAGKTSFFETVLSSNETNDGFAEVTIPDNSNTQARFKIQCSNNIFYDISNADLNITGNTAFATTGNTVAYNTLGLLINDNPTENNCVTGGGGAVDESNDSFASAQLIEFDTTNNFVIQISGDKDFFQFTLPEAGILEVQTSGNTDTFCSLFDNAQNFLLENDDEGDLLNCKMNATLDQGAYFVQVQGFGISAVGAYSISVTFTPSDEAEDEPDTGSIGLYWIFSLLLLVFIRGKLNS